MLPVRTLTVLGAIGVLSGCLAAQSLDRSLSLDDGDPLSIDHGFGVTLDPDGVHLYATIAGDLSFGNPTAFNNDNVVKFDLLTGAQVAIGSTGLYPEDITITHDAQGAARFIYVSNSTSGTVSCLTPALQPVATIALSPCFGSVFLGSFPFGMLLSPDETRLYVTTVGGCDTIEVLDVDPASPTFNTRVGSFTVVGGGGRPSWWNYPLMVVPTSTFDASFTYALGGFTVVDVTNPLLQTPHLVTAPIVNHFTAAYEAQVISGGRVLLTVGFEVFPTVYLCDVATGNTITSLNLNAITGLVLHGLGVNADETVGAATSLNGGETALFSIPALTLLSTWDHGSTARPNDATFTPDGSRLIVSMQGRTRVDILKQLPGYDLRLIAPPTVALGATFTAGLDHCESGQPWAIYASPAGPGPTIIGPYTIALSTPFDPLFGGVGDLHGVSTAVAAVPAVSSLSGLTIYLQAVTVDRDGGIRLSLGQQTTIL